MRKVVGVAALGICLALGACGTSPDPCLSASGEALCAYRPIAVNDVRLKDAVAQGVAQLREPAWLGRADLRAGSIKSGERQVVVDTNYRVTLDLLQGDQRRPARLWVNESRQGGSRLFTIDLGPLGNDAPLLDVPEPASLPGGWTERLVDDPEIVAAAETASLLLADANWLGRRVTLVKTTEAMTQVVSGLNIYLSLDVQVDDRARQIDVIVYQPIQAPGMLSWLRLGP